MGVCREQQTRVCSLTNLGPTAPNGFQALPRHVVCVLEKCWDCMARSQLNFLEGDFGADQVFSLMRNEGGLVVLVVRSGVWNVGVGDAKLLDKNLDLDPIFSNCVCLSLHLCSAPHSHTHSFTKGPT